MPTPNNKPNNLKYYREKHAYTQQQVARILEMTSNNRISQWEQGKARPSIENLFKLAALYGISPQTLYTKDFRKLTKRFKTTNRFTKAKRKKQEYQEEQLPRTLQQDLMTDDELLQEYADILVDVLLEEMDNESLC